MLKEYMCTNESDAVEFWVDDKDRALQHIRDGLKVFVRLCDPFNKTNKEWKPLCEKMTRKMTYEKFEKAVDLLLQSKKLTEISKEADMTTSTVMSIKHRQTYYSDFKKKYIESHPEENRYRLWEGWLPYLHED